LSISLLFQAASHHNYAIALETYIISAWGLILSVGGGNG